MRAINHALTGAVIGLTLPVPLALPAALVSHFVLDAFPHFGSRNTDSDTKAFNVILVVDALLCIGLVAYLFGHIQDGWLVPSICAFLATSPDFMWIAKYRRAQAGLAEEASRNVLLKFHTWIQWFQRPTGLIIEIIWAAAMLCLLARYV